MATAYSTYDTTAGLVVEQLKQKILASSDWAHLQLSTGTQNTTLAASASPGAVSISTTATIPSGSYVVIGNGAANPEVRLTTGVSGSGPYTVTFATALVGTYSNGAAVGVGTYVKGTTTRGAQMVVDLADAAPTTNRLQLGIYRTHDGTTAVDKVTRYLSFNSVTPATSTPVHCVVSAGKEHLYFKVAGPYTSEAGFENSGWGSPSQAFFLCDVIPYHAGDTVPAVVLGAHNSAANADQTYTCWVSRNQNNNASWVQGYLLTLSGPPRIANQPYMVNPQPLSYGDNKYYVWPYVVVEVTNGLRGRASSFFFAGNTYAATGGEVAPTPGTRLTYSGAGYTLHDGSRTGVSYDNANAFYFTYRQNGGWASGTLTYGNSTAIAIPNGL